MEQDTLWAPWRLAYVQGRDRVEPAAAIEPDRWRKAADPACFLCRAAACDPRHDRPLGVVCRGPATLVVVNRYPYANGHLLVAPLDHRPGLHDLDAAVLLELQQQVVRWCGVIERSLQAQGFNVGLNVGRVAGAGVPGHLHWHVVPRWNGDVNFMPVVAGTRVLSQSLDSLWEQLVTAGGSAP